MEERAFRVRVRTSSGFSVISRRMSQEDIDKLVEHLADEQMFKTIATDSGYAFIRGTEIEAILMNAISRLKKS